jgi:hypothetical protein
MIKGDRDTKNNIIILFNNAFAYLSYYDRQNERGIQDFFSEWKINSNDVLKRDNDKPHNHFFFVLFFFKSE